MWEFYAYPPVARLRFGGNANDGLGNHTGGGVSGCLMGDESSARRTYSD